MNHIFLITALAIGTASTAFAYNLSGVETKEILDLSGPTKGAKLKPEAIATQPLEAEGIAELVGHNLRTRFWTIGGPKGIAPIHEHSNRPAVFTVASGGIYEYSSIEDEPILQKTGGSVKESVELDHWWHNAGTETVHLIAFDVQSVAKGFAAVTAGEIPAHSEFDLPVASGAQNDLLGDVDIGGHFEGAYGSGWALTTYRTTLVPGGVFPDFTGLGEPPQAFLWSGEVQDHRSDMVAPVTLADHSGSNLANGATAYWENIGYVDAEVYFGAVEPLNDVSGIDPVGVLAHGEH